MRERLSGTVTNISFIEKIDTGLDLCELTIDFDKVKIYYDSNELFGFLNQNVYYTVRPDMVHGQVSMVICEIALVSTIQTVATTDNVKLIPEGTKRTVCNFSIDEVRFGEFYPRMVAYCSGYTPGASSKSKWFDLTMIDMNSKQFTLKIFARTEKVTTDVESLVIAAVGHYIEFNLEMTKFGYRTDDIYVMPNVVEVSPEVEVAKAVIMREIEKDEALTAYDKMHQIVQNLTSVIDGEPGYALVRIASEIYMINAVDNISNELDIRAMKRAAICSRAYLLPHTTNWSRPLINTNRVLRTPILKDDKEMLLILDVLAETEPSPTKLTYLKIRGLVDDIIKIRRGVKDEKDIASIVSLNSMFNGLL